MSLFETIMRRIQHPEADSRKDSARLSPMPPKGDGFPLQVASRNVEKIEKYVNLMLGESKLFGCRETKNETYSLFERSEIRAGRRLGTGGFSDVFEIEGFTMKSHDPATTKSSDYIDVSRQFYTDTAKRESGECRYVIKHLKRKLVANPSKFRMAASDLAVEGLFLSTLDHPHILKLRGWSSESTNSYKDGSHDGYFLILDRLQGDLSGRIADWKRQECALSRQLLKARTKTAVAPSVARSRNLVERVKVAYQIASALEYLHENNVIFRDLKPDNVGIDADGNVRLFDFGLAREIPSEGDGMQDVFYMSGKIGTRRYMAPEVALCKDYNLKADVYSWACNFYEILALEKPYKTYNQEMHKEFCCKRGLRPELWAEWPDSIRNLIERSWAQELRDRPTMTEVVESLKLILLELGSGNVDLLTIQQHRKSSVVLELPKNFASFVGGGRCNLSGDSATLETSPESVAGTSDSRSNGS